MNEQIEDTAVVIVQLVLRELEDRGGFDSWWDDIDSDIQEEIQATLTEIVIGALSV